MSAEEKEPESRSQESGVQAKMTGYSGESEFRCLEKSIPISVYSVSLW